MTISKKSFLAVLALVTASGALVFALAASADHGRRGGDDHGVRGKLFVTRLVGSILSDPPIHGITRGGVPWDLKRGGATLGRSGRFKLRVKGLVVAGTGNADGVTSISASFFCAPDSSTAVFTAGPVPLSPDGDARIKQHVTVPARCLAPVVLVHPNGNPARYIAASGFTT
jgi:hypothetical protein